MKNIMRGLVLAGAVGTLFGCGVKPEDLIGTWVYDAGAQQVSTCTDMDPITTDLAGSSWTFVSGGEAADLMVDVEGDCDSLYNLDGSSIVSAGYASDTCLSGEGYTITTSGAITMDYDGGVITFGGSATSTIDYEDNTYVADMECTVTMTGTATMSE